MKGCKTTTRIDQSARSERPAFLFAVASAVLLSVVAATQWRNAIGFLFVFMYGGAATLAMILLRSPRFHGHADAAPQVELRAARERHILVSIRALAALSASSIGLMVLSIEDSLFFKPVAFYLLAGAGAGFLFLETLLRGSKVGGLATGRENLWLFGRIVAYAIVLRVATQWINPYVWGTDSYVHINYIANGLERTGFLSKEVMFQYFYYPLFHVLTWETSLLSSMPVSLGLEFAAQALNLVAILPLYGVVRILTRENRIAHVAALLWSIAPYQIFSSISYSIMFSSITFAVYTLLIILKSMPDGKQEHILAYWLIALFVFFVHPFAALVLIVLYLASTVTRMRSDQRPGMRVGATYAVCFVAYLAFVNVSLFRDVTFRVLFLDTIPAIDVGSKLRGNLELLLPELVFAYLGLTTIVFLGAATTVVWFSRKSAGPLLVAAFVALLHLIPALALASDVPGVESARYVGFATGFVILPASVFLANAALRGSGIRRIGLTVLIAIVAVSNTSSYLTSDINEFGKHIPTGVPAPSDSALSTHSFLARMQPGAVVYMDPETWRYVVSGERGLLEVPNITARDIQSLALSSQPKPFAVVVNRFYLDRRAVDLDTLEAITATDPRASLTYASGIARSYSYQ